MSEQQPGGLARLLQGGQSLGCLLLVLLFLVFLAVIAWGLITSGG